MSSSSEVASTSPLGMISPNSSSSVDLPSVWNGKFWGKTNCNNESGNVICEYGNCESNSVHCQNNGSTLSVSLSEFSIGEDGNLSFYDISLIDGFNLPLTISPSPKSASKNSSDEYCGSPSCIADILDNCPAKLRVYDNNGSILACTNTCNTSDCAPNNYTHVINSLCPTVFSSPSDSGRTFACSDADFTITFCSGDNLQSATPPLSTVSVTDTSYVTPFSPAPATHGVSYITPLSPAPATHGASYVTPLSPVPENAPSPVTPLSPVPEIAPSPVTPGIGSPTSGSIPPSPAIAPSPVTPGIGSPTSGSIPPSHARVPDHSGRSRHSIRPVLIAGICTGVIVIVGIIFVRLIWTRRNRRRNEGEPNISGIGPRRFKYRELYYATKGFNPSELLGQGGQGQVYKGILRRGGLQVAIKKLAPENGGRRMRDLVSELRIISDLRHRNLVQLQGWCKHKGELMVVYDYMPNGSLDKLLFANSEFFIDWHVRYGIICGLGTALLYLHEEGEKRVVHRDVKPSNVMLDATFEPKLGDFGLARVIDRDVTPRSTTAAGTIGYTAPEISTTRVPTPESDVFSFGIVALEVACGRESFILASESGFFFLLQKVRELNKQGRVMEAIDPRLAAGGFDVDEMKRLIFVGLASTVSDPEKRPTIRQLLAILTKQAPAAALEDLDITD